MTRTFLTAFATLGMVIAGAVTSVLLVGVAEGIRTLPDLVASLVGVGVFLAAMALAGRVAVDVGGPNAIHGVLLAGLLVSAGGWLAAQATESNGESLEASTVVQLAAGLVVLLIASVWANRRLSSARRRPRSSKRASGPGGRRRPT